MFPAFDCPCWRCPSAGLHLTTRGAASRPDSRQPSPICAGKVAMPEDFRVGLVSQGLLVAPALATLVRQTITWLEPEPSRRG
jgi:hypothetical protein